MSDIKNEECSLEAHFNEIIAPLGVHIYVILKDKEKKIPHTLCNILFSSLFSLSFIDLYA